MTHTIKVFVENDIYIFRFTEATKAKAMRLCGMFAADARLNFTWSDAAQVCKAIRSLSWEASNHGQQQSKI